MIVIFIIYTQHSIQCLFNMAVSVHNYKAIWATLHYYTSTEKPLHAEPISLKISDKEFSLGRHRIIGTQLLSILGHNNT